MYLQYLALLRSLVHPVVSVTRWEPVPIESRSRQLALTVSIMPDTVYFRPMSHMSLWTSWSSLLDMAEV